MKYASSEKQDKFFGSKLNVNIIKCLNFFFTKYRNED